MTTQYLKTSNHYERQLLAFAEHGERYIVHCTDESSEPFYTGYITLAEAEQRAKELNEEFPDYTFAVLELIQDDEGDWATTY